MADPFDPQTRVDEVSPAAARDLADAGAVLVDVREPDEWAAGHIADAQHIPLGDLDPDLFVGGPLVVAVCRSGHRSGTAALRLHDAGVDVRNMTGGMKAWQADGLPVTRDDGTTGSVA